MHTRLLCAALLLLIAPLGCRSQGELDLAERDMRLQENRIYKLQEYVQQYQQMLEDCQAENESLRKQLAGGGNPAAAPRSDKPRTLRELINSNKPGAGAAAPSTGPSLTLPISPSIDLGTEFDPATATPEAKPATEKKPASTVPTPPGFGPPAAAGELPEPDELPAPTPGAATGQKTTSLAIRAVGQMRGNATVPGGLLIVIEPRSAQGGLARPPEGAKMSLMIVSGPQEEPAGRWDYSAEQTASAFRSGFGATNGWRYVVPFNKTTGSSDQHKVYVRLVLPDGTKLMAEREFDADAGASLEEIPSGDAGWFRSRQPIASLANKLGREAREAFGSGPNPTSGNTAPGFTPRTSTGRSGNAAPGWQTQPLEPPAVSTGSAGSSPRSAPTSNGTPAAQNWSPSEIPTVPLGSQLAPSAAGPRSETATRPDRPSWSPYR